MDTDPTEVIPTEIYEPELLTVAIYECSAPARLRFYLLLRILDTQSQQEYPIAVYGNISCLHTLKFDMTIPNKEWSKTERLRLKKGYKKKGVLDVNESTLHEILPKDIAKYREVIALSCEKAGVSTRRFKDECKLAYFLFPDATLKLVSQRDIFERTSASNFELTPNIEIQIVE